ncbi:MAG: outer membrane protein assembly factor BamB [Gammaproteobacteria bacterium]|nr:outer membrane protein assembly factor BamB [Gammaproteobacteria bacterium]
MIRFAIIASSLCFLVGCASEPPRNPPNPIPLLDTNEPLAGQWSKDIGSSGAGQFEPLLLSDSVVFANRKGVVTKLALDSGERQWRVDLGVTLGAGVGGDSSQYYVSDKDGAVIALSADSGEEVWRKNASTEVLRPASVAYDTVLVRSADGRLLALEPADGDERWSATYTPPALTINGYSKPLLLEGGVLAGLDDGRLIALALNNGRPIWESVLSVPSGRSEVERLVDVDADIQVDNEAIYVVTYGGKLARVEPGKGQIVWSTDMSSTAGLTVLDQVIVVVDEFDVLHAVDKSNGSVLWTQDALKGRRLTPPTAIGDQIVVGDLEGYVHLVNPVSGDFSGRMLVGDKPIRSAPKANGTSVVVQSTDGTVRLFNRTAP